MMEKVLVEIYIPSVNETYDMFIPLKAPMYEVLELIKKAAAELTEGRFRPDEGTAICTKKDGSVININRYVFELGIRNGTKLMLI